ncbi:molybdate ABC transporter substrate-binding protein [Pontibacter sp. JAM-7]|uniref:molybdate ABC transporter substrate-binding protein n=1 Tax=Pontibacter sp. JAM-7 TaxID=3366581 RepID=UPI003AF5CC71
MPKSRWLSLALMLLSPLSVAEEIYIAVAANFAAPMKAIAWQYEQQTGHQVHLSFGASGKFYAQLLQGAPFHLFLSADQEKPAALEQQGLTVAGSRFTYAVGSLALWTPRTGMTLNADTLKTTNFNHLALANPKLAPYGAAAILTMEHHNLITATQNRWVMGENIAQTYQFVSTGNADFGFVAMSQIFYQGQLKTGSAWIVPTNLYPPIRQDAVLLKHAADSVAAIGFLDFMRSKSATHLMQQYGYSTPE